MTQTILKEISNSTDKNRLNLSLAYVQCLTMLPEDKISVKAVTDQCGMTRQHFYKYFEDLNALIYWFNAYHITAVLDRYDFFVWDICIPEILQIMAEHKDFYTLSAKNSFQKKLKAVMYKDVYFLYLDILGYHFSGPVPEEYEHLLFLYCHGAVSYLYNWFQHGMKESVEEVTRVFRDGLPPKIQPLLLKEMPIAYLKSLGRDMARMGIRSDYHL